MVGQAVSPGQPATARRAVTRADIAAEFGDVGMSTVSARVAGLATLRDRKESNADEGGCAPNAQMLQQPSNAPPVTGRDRSFSLSPSACVGVHLLASAFKLS